MSAYPPRAASFIGDKARRFDRLKLNLAILALLILIYDLVPETIILINPSPPPVCIDKYLPNQFKGGKVSALAKNHKVSNFDKTHQSD